MGFRWSLARRASVVREGDLAEDLAVSVVAVAVDAVRVAAGAEAEAAHNGAQSTELGAQRGWI